MIQPPDYDESRDVCLSQRSLYGLKQAGNVWNHELNLYYWILDIDFTQLKTYNCYIRRQDKDFTIIFV